MLSSRPSNPTAIDVQAQLPTVQVSISRVGVTGVEKVIRLRQNGIEQLFSAKFECVVDLGPEQKGAHMSRFEEVVNEVIGDVVLGESPFKAEMLAEHIAQLVRERQVARRAEVSVEARFPEHKPAPVSGIQTQELYTLHGSAVASQIGTRRLIGVTAQGMTACPCAQELVAGAARERLAGEGFDAEEIDRIIDAVPVATHNQRGLGTLYIGCTESCDDEIDAATLLEIVEQSMSSEIYELMKRSGRGREGPSPTPLRRGLRARDDPRRDRGVPRPRRRYLRLGTPAQPRDDPSAQRGRRALRHARRDPPRARLGHADQRAHEPSPVARWRGLKAASGAGLVDGRAIEL